MSEWLLEKQLKYKWGINIYRPFSFVFPMECQNMCCAVADLTAH